AMSLALSNASSPHRPGSGNGRIIVGKSSWHKSANSGRHRPDRMMSGGIDEALDVFGRDCNARLVRMWRWWRRLERQLDATSASTSATCVIGGTATGPGRPDRPAEQSAIRRCRNGPSGLGLFGGYEYLHHQPARLSDGAARHARW